MGEFNVFRVHSPIAFDYQKKVMPADSFCFVFYFLVWRATTASTKQELFNGTHTRAHVGNTKENILFVEVQFP